MGWLDPTHLMALLVVTAVVAALCLHSASALTRSRRRRSRRLFALGFSAGWAASSILGGRTRRPKGLQRLALHAKRARAIGLARPSR